MNNDTHGSASQTVPETAPAGPEAPLATLARRSPEQVAEYHRAKRAVRLADLGIGLLYWLIWLALAPGFATWLELHIASPWAALAVATLVMFGGLVIVGLPLSFFSGYLLEKEYDLTNQTPRTWLLFEAKTWLVGVILGAILVGGLYALLWYAGTLWAVWVWIGVMLFSVVMAKIFPLVILPLFYPSTPLDRPSLNERLRQMAATAGMIVTGVFSLALSKDTKKANAMLAGLGSTRRVYLSDTLLDAFGDDEIAVVFAHELGHHIRGHIVKAIGLAAGVSSVLVAVIWWRLDPYAGVPSQWTGAVAGLAQVGLIMAALPLVIAPVSNAISRHFERQADRDALRLTDDPEAYRATFRKLTGMNLVDPDPPRWEVVLFEDHPPMAERIAAADRYVRGS